MASNFAEALFQGRNDAISSRLGQQQAQREQQRFDMGMQKEERALETDKRKALYDLASGYKSFIAKNPQGGQQYYETFLKPSLAGLGLGDAGPYDPAAVESVADQVIAAYGGQQQGSGVQSTYIDNQGNRVAIMRDGSTQVLGQNAPNNKIIDSGNGFVGVNPINLQAAPVMLGGSAPAVQPQAVPQRQGTNQDADAVASRLNAYRDQLMAAGVQGPQLDAVLNAAEQQLFGAMPDPPVAQAPQGNQLRSAPKTQSPSELERRLSIAASMGATPEQQRAMVLGSASTKGPSAAEQKDALARKAKQPQVANVARGLDRIATALQSLSGGMVNTGPIDQYATRYTKAGQELEAAVGGIQNSLLSLTRVPGIGSQSDLEARIAAMQYPSLDKDPEVNARTLQNLQAFVSDLQEAYRMADAQDSAAVPEEGDDIDSLLDMYR